MSTCSTPDNSILLHYTIPCIDLSCDIKKQFLTDRENGQYLGHPDSILLNNGTIYVFYPKGHGKGEIVMKKSTDLGISWSDRLSVPFSWHDSKETPTIYLIEKPDGKIRLQMISGLPQDPGGFRTAYSEDNGETWSEFTHYFANEGLHCIVALASLTRLKRADGSYDYKWMGIFHDEKFNNYKTYLTFDENGNEQWTFPERLLPEHDDIEKHAALCEIEVLRSPDGKQLALLARAQNKVTNSMIAFSDDEGKTWTRPREMQGSLMGERHKAAYDPVSGRLLITFREIIRNDKSDNDWVAGNWCAWIGTYDDLVNNREGEYRITIMRDYTPTKRSGDCGYAGNVVSRDGTFVLTSYGHWDEKSPEECYVMTVRLKLSETDNMIQGTS